MLNNDSYLYNLLNVLKPIGKLYKRKADLSVKIRAVVIKMCNSHVYSKVGVIFPVGKELLMRRFHSPQKRIKRVSANDRDCLHLTDPDFVGKLKYNT